MQNPEGDVAALRLTLVSIAISLVAVILSDVLQRTVSRRLAP